MATRPKSTAERDREAHGDTFSAWQTPVWDEPTPRPIHVGSYGWNYRTGEPAPGLGFLEGKGRASVPVYIDCISYAMGPDTGGKSRRPTSAAWSLT